MCNLACLPSLMQSGMTGFPAAGTPAGTVVVRAADLLVRGDGTVTAGGAAPSAGELAVFCRPVVTAPAVVRRDGTVLADAWLPDLVRLGELERHLGDGVIEAIVDAAVAGGAAEAAAAAPADVVSAGHPADDRDDADAGRLVLRGAAPGSPGCSRTSRSPGNGTSRRRKWSRTGGCRSRRT